MSFKIERGLFKLDLTDHYAVLGVPIDAEGGEVRKRYLKIARRLHPDSCKAESETEKQLANQLLSKLVNPAYEQLHPDKSRAEYKLILGRMGQRLATEAIKINSEVAKQLAKAGGSLDYAYKTSLQDLAKTQYESIPQALDAIAQISELNAVYLMMKQSSVGGARPTLPSSPPPPPASRVPTRSANASKPPQTAQTQAEKREGPLAEPYLRRAQEYMGKNLFAKAVLELRDALKIEPNNSRCHGLLGIAYLKQNQATMAKVHINKALELNPKDDVALQGKEILNRLAAKASGGTPKTSGTSPNQPGGKQPDKPSGGGLFGGMFGGKKK